MNIELQSPSPAPSNMSVPSLRRASISTATSAQTLSLEMQPIPAPADVASPKTPPAATSDALIPTSRKWQDANWMKKDESRKLLREWQDKLKALIRLGIKKEDTQEILPWTLQEWAALKQATVACARRSLQRSLNKSKERDGHLNSGELFKGKKLLYNVNRSAVLSLPTTWCKNINREYGAHIWPSPSELRFEGIDRISTATDGDPRRFRRCLPLVRQWTSINMMEEGPDGQEPEGWQNIKGWKFHFLDDVDTHHWLNANRYYDDPDLAADGWLNGEDLEEVPEPSTEDIPALLNAELLKAFDENDFSIEESSTCKAPWEESLKNAEANMLGTENDTLQTSPPMLVNKPLPTGKTVFSAGEVAFSGSQTASPTEKAPPTEPPPAIDASHEVWSALGSEA